MRESAQEAPAILLIQLRRLGDVLMMTPALRALRHAFPGARLDVLTEAPGAELLAGNPYLNRIWVRLPGRSALQWARLAAELRRSRYDVAIDFNGLPSSALLAWVSGAPRTIGYALRGRGLLYGQRMPLPGSGYVALHKLALLQPLGVTSTQSHIDFFTGPSEQAWAKDFVAMLGVEASDRLVTLSPVSRQAYKVWPARHFATVADHLIARHKAKVLVLYGPGEKHFAESVKAHMQCTPLTLDYPMPSLRQTRAIFDHTHMHIGNDNGPAHFAIAAGTRVVTIFGRPQASNWTPPDNPKVHAFEFDPGCKQSCHYPSCQLECLGGTEPSSVIRKIDTLWQQ